MNTRAKYALFCLLGILFGAGGTFGVRYAKEIRVNQNRAQKIIDQQRQCATAGGQPVTQEGWDFAQKAIRLQHETIERLSAELAEAKANPAAKMLAQTGHVMNEEQCRAWAGISK